MNGEVARGLAAGWRGRVLWSGEEVSGPGAGVLRTEVGAAGPGGRVLGPGGFVELLPVVYEPRARLSHDLGLHPPLTTVRF